MTQFDVILKLVDQVTAQSKQIASGFTSSMTKMQTTSKTIGASVGSDFERMTSRMTSFGTIFKATLGANVTNAVIQGLKGIAKESLLASENGKGMATAFTQAHAALVKTTSQWTATNSLAGALEEAAMAAEHLMTALGADQELAAEEALARLRGELNKFRMAQRELARELDGAKMLSGEAWFSEDNAMLAIKQLQNMLKDKDLVGSMRDQTRLLLENVLQMEIRKNPSRDVKMLQSMFGLTPEAVEIATGIAEKEWEKVVEELDRFAKEQKESGKFDSLNTMRDQFEKWIMPENKQHQGMGRIDALPFGMRSMFDNTQDQVVDNKKLLDSSAGILGFDDPFYTERQAEMVAREKELLDLRTANWQSHVETQNALLNNMSATFLDAANASVEALASGAITAPEAARQMAIGVIRGLAQEARVKALYELAMGFAALANPYSKATAPFHFKAAAMFGAVSLGASAAAGAMSRGAAGGSGGGGGVSNPLPSRQGYGTGNRINTSGGSSSSSNHTVIIRIEGDIVGTPRQDFIDNLARQITRRTGDNVRFA